MLQGWCRITNTIILCDLNAIPASFCTACCSIPIKPQVGSSVYILYIVARIIALWGRDTGSDFFFFWNRFWKISPMYRFCPKSMQIHEITQSFICAYPYCTEKKLESIFGDFSFLRQREYPCPGRLQHCWDTDLQAFLGRDLDAKSWFWGRDPKCYTGGAGSFPLSFSVISTRSRPFKVLFNALFVQFCEEIQLWRDFGDPV